MQNQQNGFKQQKIDDFKKYGKMHLNKKKLMILKKYGKNVM